MSQGKPLTIVGLGEAVFDLFEDRAVLGGAPLNLAVCAHQCLAALGGAGVVASRVGRDQLGRRLVRDLTGLRMETDYVQLDPDRPTGQINVSFEAGEPSYEICAPAAWDAMQLDGRWAALAKSCAGVSFGTLAQRSAMSREAIWRFLTTANSAVRLLDVNLREDFYTPTILEQSLHLADAVKLNEQELGTIGPLLKVPLAANLVADRACEALLENYQLRFVALTRGSRGTVLYRPGQRIESPPVSYPPAADADPVGAGDAASAGLLVGSILDWPLEQTLELANHLGAFAASVSGATPRLSERLLTMIGG